MIQKIFYAWDFNNFLFILEVKVWSYTLWLLDFPFFFSLSPSIFRLYGKKLEFIHVDFSVLRFFFVLLPMSLIILQETRFMANWTFTFYGPLICIDGKGTLSIFGIFLP